MPLPSPRKGESTDRFIERGMSNPTMKREFPDTKQRLAVLYNIIRQKRGNSSVGRKPDSKSEKSETYAMMAHLKETLGKQYSFAVPSPVGIVSVNGQLVGYYLPLDSRLIYLSLVAPALRQIEGNL